MGTDLEGGNRDRIYWVISVIGGVAYLLTSSLGNYPGRPLIKALAIGALAVLALRRAADHRWPGGMTLLAAALGFSCLGDVLLALRIEQSFLLGLSAFLLAHITYIIIFARRWRRPLRPGFGRLAVTAAILLFSILFARWLAPGLGTMALPVTIYICAITLMVVSCLWAGFPTPWAATGAILFMISDSIIAADKFRTEIPFSGYLIWATYYLGQVGIAFSYLREETDQQGIAKRAVKE